MPIDPFLTAATWKSAGLTKRTAAEKIKFKKTNVSEAMRAYEGVAGLGPNRNPDKQAKLKALKVTLAKCKADHRANTAFVAYIDNVEKGIVREAARLNKELKALTLDIILNTPAIYTGFHAYCKDVEHNHDPLEFLHDVKANVAPATLIATYVLEGSPKEVNISGTKRQAWINAPGNTAAKAAVVQDVRNLINENEVDRFKKKMAITL